MLSQMPLQDSVVGSTPPTQAPKVPSAPQVCVPSRQAPTLLPQLWVSPALQAAAPPPPPPPTPPPAAAPPPAPPPSPPPSPPSMSPVGRTLHAQPERVANSTATASAARGREAWVIGGAPGKSAWG